MAKQSPTKRTKKPLRHRIKTYNFFLVLAALLGMMAGVFMVKLFYNDGLTAPRQPQSGDCRTLEGEKYCKDDYLGLSESDAVAKAKKDGRTYRVVARDGESFPVTDDYSEHRLNFTVENNIITKVEFY